MTYDVRAVANFLLDVADDQGVELTNLSLNKLIYFLHAESLVRDRLPLTSAKIEAWKFGPVFREVYSQFRSNGARPIKGRAKRIDRTTGEIVVCTLDADEQTKNLLSGYCAPFLHMSASQLVTLSHRVGDAWHEAFYHESDSNPGMAITDEAITRLYAPRPDQSRH